MRVENIEKYQMSELDVRFAQRVRERRLDLKLTQNEVAKHLGVTRGAFSHIETGRTKIKNNQLKLLADKLQKPVSYFLDTDEEYIRDESLNQNKEIINKIVKNFRIKDFLERKKYTQEFIDEMESSVCYVCELYGINPDDVWGPEKIVK